MLKDKKRESPLSVEIFSLFFTNLQAKTMLVSRYLTAHVKNVNN